MFPQQNYFETINLKGKYNQVVSAKPQPIVFKTKFERTW